MDAPTNDRLVVREIDLQKTTLLIVRQTDEILIIPCDPPGRFATQASPRRHARHQTGVDADIPQFLLNLRPGTIAHVITRSERYAGRSARPVQTVADAPLLLMAFNKTASLKRRLSRAGSTRRF